ncbi:MAG: TetR/AcrR family transcriptional regulator [Acidimicrobiia bacterium]
MVPGQSAHESRTGDAKSRNAIATTPRQKQPAGTPHRARRSRGGTQPLPLNRDDVLQAALPVLARTGVDGLTVRAVAEELGVTSPAIYHYFAGRDDLIDRLCEKVAAEVDIGIDPADSWDRSVVRVLLNMDRTFARYPGVAARVMPGLRPSGAVDRITRVVIDQIRLGGFDEEQAEDLLAALQFLFAGWLLGRRPSAPGRAARPDILERSIRCVLDGSRHATS